MQRLNRGSWFLQGIVLTLAVLAMIALGGCDTGGGGLSELEQLVVGTYANTATSAIITFKSDLTYSGLGTSETGWWRQAGTWEVLSNGRLKIHATTFDTSSDDGKTWDTGDGGTMEGIFLVNSAGLFFPALDMPYPDGEGGQENVTILVGSRRAEGKGTGLTGIWDYYCRREGGGSYYEFAGTSTIDAQAGTVSYVDSIDDNGDVNPVTGGPSPYTLAGSVFTIIEATNIEQRLFTIDADHMVIAMIMSTETPPTLPATVTTIGDIMYARQ